MPEAPMLSVSKDDSNPEIVVLRDCSIRWSTDTSTWYDMGPRQAGHVFRDAASTAINPRSYMAVDGDRTQTFYSRGAAMSFADMLEPWIPTRVNPEFLIEFSLPHPTEGNPVGPFSSEKAAKRWARANAPEGAGWKVLEQRCVTDDHLPKPDQWCPACRKHGDHYECWDSNEPVAQVEMFTEVHDVMKGAAA